MSNIEVSMPPLTEVKAIPNTLLSFVDGDGQRCCFNRDKVVAMHYDKGDAKLHIGLEGEMTNLSLNMNENDSDRVFNGLCLEI